jgi:selT/selW/selH-like putative selenoprotein
LAAELESELQEDAELVQSSGGIFEVEDNGVLIFSKQALGRFPADFEILRIVKALSEGKTIEEAKQVASENVNDPISFVDWFRWKMTRPTDT